MYCAIVMLYALTTFVGFVTARRNREKHFTSRSIHTIMKSASNQTSTTKCRAAKLENQFRKLAAFIK